jgi:hypothetical protein
MLTVCGTSDTSISNGKSFINDSNNSVEMTDASWEVPFQGKLSSPCSANEMKDLSFEIDVSEVPHTVNIDCIIEVNF